MEEIAHCSLGKTWIPVLVAVIPVVGAGVVTTVRPVGVIIRILLVGVVVVGRFVVVRIGHEIKKLVD